MSAEKSEKPSIGRRLLEGWMRIAGRFGGSQTLVILSMLYAFLIGPVAAGLVIGWTAPAGRLPALKPRKRSPPMRFSTASPRMLRAELPVHRKRMDVRVAIADDILAAKGVRRRDARKDDRFATSRLCRVPAADPRIHSRAEAKPCAASRG